MTALLGGVPVAVSATQGQGESGGPPGSDDDESGDGRGMEIPVARPSVGDLDGDTLSGDMAFQVENRYDGDLADDAGGSHGHGEDDREWVLYSTTDGEETHDYHAALLNLRERLEDPLPLEALQADGQHAEVEFLEGGGGLAFDYDHLVWFLGVGEAHCRATDRAREFCPGHNSLGVSTHTMECTEVVTKSIAHRRSDTERGIATEGIPSQSVPSRFLSSAAAP